MIEYKGKNVMLMACSSCNIKKCKHCYISYTGDRTPENLKNIVNNLKNKYKVIINGAEILINQKYFESYKLINQDWVLSNGVAIHNNPSVLNYLKEQGIKEVCVSYHFGIQNEISIVQNEKIEETIKLLKENGMECEILVTINSQNYNMVEEICNKVVSLGAHSIEFTNFIIQGNALTMSENNVLSQEQINEFFDGLRKSRNKYSKDVLKINRSGSFGKDFKNENCHFSCFAGTNQVVITPDDNVYPCLFFAKPGYEIGKYENGKVLLFDEIKHDGKSCFAYEYCNKNNRSIMSKLNIKNL